ncbi:aspartate aminotransferase family protein [Papillibacter cinnamivorans]|uniref:Acetylornithine aminotransferase n=1 Tax=Papillibacter cinnamivorans DSM 12816 TaxID=1122930 RepID=A0A1W2AWM4_9FIRM|nr:aspartate aminotransferase family protein [Papillibacter cinnamivorans]SMC65109.1 acetylornithine/N-succinyldiaminopimelate aminotransferase [Papillibacter cinnamivorans DSM 12816]
MTFEQLKAKDVAYVLATYPRYPVAFERGEGARLYDLSGKEYIDFSSGIGVASIGHGNQKWAEAILEQALKLGHVSNLYYTQPYADLAEVVCRRSGMSGVFFANSGAEANEGAIKLARKYSFDKYGKGRGTIITLKQSFHGRTAATLAATGQDVFHNYFFPFPEGFRYAEPNDIESVRREGGPDVCAVMLELVQGEGGVYLLDREFIHALAVLCAERDWLLIVDEVQTGIGRTGTFFAYQQYGILPDVVTFAKGIAGGLPLGGFLCSERTRGVLTPGTHATTFGGNPVCCAAALAVMDILDEEALAQVEDKGNYIRESIREMKSPYIAEVRGLGLMIGVRIKDMTHKEAVNMLLANGLVCLTAGQDTLRLLPPLTITKEEIDKGLKILKAVL